MDLIYPAPGSLSPYHPHVPFLCPNPSAFIYHRGFIYHHSDSSISVLLYVCSPATPSPLDATPLSLIGPVSSHKGAQLLVHRPSYGCMYAPRLAADPATPRRKWRSVLDRAGPKSLHLVEQAHLHLFAPICTRLHPYICTHMHSYALIHTHVHPYASILSHVQHEFAPTPVSSPVFPTPIRSKPTRRKYCRMIATPHLWMHC